MCLDSNTNPQSAHQLLSCLPKLLQRCVQLGFLADEACSLAVCLRQVRLQAVDVVPRLQVLRVLQVVIRPLDRTDRQLWL